MNTLPINNRIQSIESSVGKGHIVVIYRCGGKIGPEGDRYLH